MILRLPFPILKKFTYEKPIEITFKIATLEIATKEILGCEIWDAGNYPPEQVNVAILYAAYLTACKDSYRKPEYDETDAVFWVSHMNKDAEKEFYKGVVELLGSMKRDKTEDTANEVKKK